MPPGDLTRQLLQVHPFCDLLPPVLQAIGGSPLRVLVTHVPPVILYLSILSASHTTSIYFVCETIVRTTVAITYRNVM